MTPNPSPTTGRINPTPKCPTQHRDLPLELNVLIIESLAKPELATCCRVSQSFSSIATPLLYTKLHVDLYKPNTFPMFPAEDPEESGEPGLPGEEVEVVELGDVDDQGLGPRLHTHHNRFSFTKHLTIISSHSKRISISCKRDLPLLPNLETLRIADDAYGTCSSHMSNSRSVTICPLFACLRPRRLVIDDTTPVGRTLRSGLTFPPRSVNEIVVIVGPSEKALERVALESISRGVPRSVERLSLVLQPDVGWETPSTEYPGHGILLGRKIEWARSVSMALAGAYQSKGIQITIVGAEGVRFYLSATCRGAELMVKDALKRRLAAEGWKEKDAAIKVEAIKFVEMMDYDGEV